MGIPLCLLSVFPRARKQKGPGLPSIERSWTDSAIEKSTDDRFDFRDYAEVLTRRARNANPPLASTTIMTGLSYFICCTSRCNPLPSFPNSQVSLFPHWATSILALLISIPMNFSVALLFIVSSRYNTGACTSYDTVFSDPTTVRAFSRMDTATPAARRSQRPNDNRSAVSFPVNLSLFVKDTNDMPRRGRWWALRRPRARSWRW